MGPRLAYQDSDVLQRFVKHINAAGAVVTQSGWPEPIQNLMLIPASQIDGCAVCVGMHTKDAEHAGEPALRLNLVEAWRDAEVFNEEERTALELAEQGTRIDKAAGASPTTRLWDEWQSFGSLVPWRADANPHCKVAT